MLILNSCRLIPDSVLQNLVDLFKPYGDVLACVIERDAQGISLGTSLIRFVFPFLSHDTRINILVPFKCNTHPCL